MNSIWLKRILFIALILAFIFPFAALVVDAAPPQQGGNIIYIVRPGDTLFWIAQRFGTSVPAIMSANGLVSDYIQAGQRLVIPLNWYPYGSSIFAPQPLPAQTPLANPTFDCSYTVQSGDTVFSIAYRNRVSVPALIQANGLSSSLIFANRPLKVPCNTGAQAFPTYTVVTGDNLLRIAVQNNTTIYALQLVNGIPNPHIIFAGQTLVIPYPDSYVWQNVPPPPGTTLTHVAISQFRTRGPKGGFDEFIELYNPLTTTVNIGNWTIRGSSVNGITDVRATIPKDTQLNAGQHFLLANKSPDGYSNTSVSSDLDYTTGIADDGGIALVNSEGTIVDQVGLSVGSVYKEGVPLAPLNSNTDRSYERKFGGSNGNCVDTGNNAADFKLNDPSAPRNKGSNSVTCSNAATATPSTSTASGAPTRTPTPTATTIPNTTFIIQHRAFTPPQITNVPVGAVITWQNGDTEQHSVKSGAPGPGQATNLFASGVMQPGASYTFTVSGPGNYPFFCEIHGAAMTGFFSTNP